MCLILGVALAHLFNLTRRQISLKDFRTHHWISAEDLQMLAAALVVGCWPWASLCLLIHLLRAPWDAGRGFIPFLGVLAMVKAYAGGKFEPFFVA